MMVSQPCVIRLAAVICWVAAGGLVGASQCQEKRPIKGYTLTGSTYKRTPLPDVFTCLLTCGQDVSCYSANFNATQRLCEMNSQTKLSNPSGFKAAPGSTYMESMERLFGWYLVDIERTGPVIRHIPFTIL